MRLYIAGPMTGYPGYNYRAFMEAQVKLQRRGYETLNPCDNDAKLRAEMATTPTWQDYMRASILQVLAADGLAVLPDAWMSRGAKLEVDLANALQLPVLPLNKWLEMRRELSEGD